MSTATVEEVQARLPEMLKALGTGGELIITDAGKPVGRLAAASAPSSTVVLGRGQGKLVRYIEDDEHLKDFEDFMP